MAAFTLSLLAGAVPALACAVCFGDADSDMARGATNGVLFMVGVVGSVLLSIASISFLWFVRARRLAHAGEVGEVE